MVNLHRDERGQSDAVYGIGVLLVILVVVALISVFVAFKKTPQGFIGLSYGAGPFESQHYQKTVNPGSGLFLNGLWDDLYLYPTTQRSYIIAEGEGDVHGTIAAPSSDRVTVHYQVATYFKLNTALIRQFHETIGLKYEAWSDEGWDRMLAESFKQQIEFALQRESRRYDVGSIFADSGTLLDIQQSVGTALKENVAQVLGDEYFCGVEFTLADPSACPEFTFVIKKVTIPDEVRAAFEKNRSSEAQIKTAQNLVQVAQEEARAIRERQQALEECGQACVLYEAIKAGDIDFWVIPSDASVVLPTRQP